MSGFEYEVHKCLACHWVQLITQIAANRLSLYIYYVRLKTMSLTNRESYKYFFSLWSITILVYLSMSTPQRGFVVHYLVFILLNSNSINNTKYLQILAIKNRTPPCLCPPRATITNWFSIIIAVGARARDVAEIQHAWDIHICGNDRKHT